MESRGEAVAGRLLSACDPAPPPHATPLRAAGADGSVSAGVGPLELRPCGEERELFSDGSKSVFGIGLNEHRRINC